MPLLAVAIAAPDTAAALYAMQQATGRADLAELRLDLMAEFDLPALLANRPLPVIVSCRPAREGGRWQGDEAGRLAVLRQAAALGADYVDLEWDAAREMASLDRSRTRVILSRHDFAAMPVDLAAQAERLWQAGADAVKLVGMAQRLADCAPALHLLANATRPTIAIAMGVHGLPSRLLAFRYQHALLSFAAPDASSDGVANASGTAPGQITLSALRDLYRVQAIDQETAFVGLLAPDAASSSALAEGNRWLASAGRNAVLIPLPTAPDEDPAAALAALQPTGGLLGCVLPAPDGLVILNFTTRGGATRTDPATGDASADLSMTACQSHSSESGRPSTSARDPSEESPLPAPTIVDALRNLLDRIPGTVPHV